MKHLNLLNTRFIEIDVFTMLSIWTILTIGFDKETFAGDFSILIGIACFNIEININL